MLRVSVSFHANGHNEAVADKKKNEGGQDEEVPCLGNTLIWQDVHSVEHGECEPADSADVGDASNGIVET